MPVCRPPLHGSKFGRWFFLEPMTSIIGKYFWTGGMISAPSFMASSCRRGTGKKPALKI